MTVKVLEFSSLKPSGQLSTLFVHVHKAWFYFLLWGTIQKHDRKRDCASCDLSSGIETLVYLL
jgi:hypothetical protein